VGAWPSVGRTTVKGEGVGTTFLVAIRLPSLTFTMVWVLFIDSQRQPLGLAGDVELPPNATVDKLRKLVKEQYTNRLAHVDTIDLMT
jgi:hypothetical protein